VKAPPRLAFCPAWCDGGHAENLHASEWAGLTISSGWHALTRITEDQRGGRTVQLAVLDADGREAVVVLTPDQADTLATIITANADDARRVP
jgi:hypothetical protein